MANAKKCDRCGTLYEYVNDHAIKNAIKTGHTRSINDTELLYHKHYDLCPNCVASLLTWLSSPKSIKNNARV